MENFNKELFDNLHPDMAKKIIKDFGLPFGYINKDHFKEMASHISNTAPEFDEVFEIISNICIQIPSSAQPQFIGFIRSATDNMVELILNSPGYQVFNSSDINADFPLIPNKIPTGDIYKLEYVGKSYISIDLKNAAFQVLKIWDMLYGKQHGYMFVTQVGTYDDFVGYTMNHTFEDSNEITRLCYEYIRACKSLRQVIFGKTNPKRIMHIEQYIMQQISSDIEQQFGISPIRFNNDELIYEYTRELEKLCYDSKTINIWYKNISRILGDVEIPIDLNMQLYTLYDASLSQRTHLIPEGSSKQINFYIKHKTKFISHLFDGYTFKKLSSSLYLIAQALYEDKMEDARFFERQPIIMDGVAHWLVGPENDSDMNTWILANIS